jgi:hypothetical protein
MVAVIVVLNLDILAGLEEPYAASGREVWSSSVLPALADIALLVAGAALGVRDLVAAIRSFTAGRQAGATRAVSAAHSL